MTLQLKSIEEEAADCRAAFEGFAVGGLVFHCHHEKLVERLSEPAENRISYILSSKSRNEQALRLRLFRPIPVEKLKADAERKKAEAEWQKAYAERQKAEAEWKKAEAEWQKDYAERQKAYAEWQKACAEREKAYAKWQKAEAEWQKDYAERQKAEAEWQKANADILSPIHAELCPGCPWDGKTIF